jgi:peptidoglycan/LPS O-acetylase OafA/YrhL
MKTMKNNISPGLSLYFDVVRFAAAIVVMLSHIWPLMFPHTPLPWPGHAAVVVFFVLSGYVIAFATDRPNLLARTYAIHRAVRILSVTVPALLLSVVIAPYVAAGGAVPFAGPMSIPDPEFWRAICVNLFFMGESWLGSSTPPFNPPFWSLSYEVWYYVIFGVWIFSTAKWRPWLTAAAVFLAGFNIVLLLPVWLLGVLIYRKKVLLPESIALKLFAATVVIGLAYYWLDCSVRIRGYMIAGAPDFIRSLNGSNQFVGDFLLGLIVAANFIAAASISRHLDVLRIVARPIRYLASFTLSVYLFHLPLTVFIWNGLHVRSVAGFALLLLTGIFVLGSMTERKNKLLRDWIEAAFTKGAGCQMVARSSAPDQDPDLEEAVHLP